MNEDLNDIHYVPIINHDYSRHFSELQYNDTVLTDAQRKETIALMDDHIALIANGIPTISSMIVDLEKREGHTGLQYVICEAMLFVAMTMADCMVATKYFLIANTDYDRRYMRGKLQVLLNEGFKKLYGYEENTKKNSVWNRLSNIIHHYSPGMQRQFEVLSVCLEKHARSSTWWKDERCFETHQDTLKLLESRYVEIEEGRVVMESLQLFDALLAVNKFLGNANGCIVNALLDKYHKGELKEE